MLVRATVTPYLVELSQVLVTELTAEFRGQQVHRRIRGGAEVRVAWPDESA
jgi:hypothetical protein